MSITEILGYISATFIGISLGLIGGGGSILSIPVLAYLFHINEKLATAYSLFIVGSTALIGGIKNNNQGLVNWKIAFLFGIPAILGLTFIRTYIIPNIPENVFSIGDFIITRRILMFGFFALLMIPAAISMLKNKQREEAPPSKPNSYYYLIILFQSLLLGAILGFVGAGGGFLIIPALVAFAKLDMKTAIGTSLIIIAMNSLIGFFISDAFSQPIDWPFLLSITFLALLGIYIGTYLGKFIDGKSLKKYFGYFIIVMAFFIFYMEFFIKNPT